MVRKGKGISIFISGYFYGYYIYLYIEIIQNSVNSGEIERVRS